MDGRLNNRFLRAGLKTALAGLGIVLALVAAEYATRLLFPTWAPATADRLFWVYDAQLGWFHRPGTVGVFRHPDFAVKVAINSQGLRDDECPPAPAPGRRRLLVVGDSQAWGYGVEREERFSECIERRRPDCEVVNAAVSGFGTDQEYLYYRERGCRLRPEVVLLLMHENDFENNARDFEYWYAKPRFVLDGNVLRLTNVPVPRRTLRQRVGTFILGRTYLYATLYRAVSKRAPVSPPPATPPAAAPAAPATAVPDREAPHAAAESKGRRAIDDDGRLTAAILHEFAESARQHGARLVVVSAPMNPARVGQVRSALEPAGVPYLPLDDAFAHRREPVRFAHDKHWNARGHAVAATAIEAFLERQGVFGPPPVKAPDAGSTPAR
ncbi:MAG: hypothetical protein BWZ02_00736 [Lentisphaerae bacterium ADurb.BinA184]|nr:MAG: hypothetical protein BWZ02_00736 [Lentisphaerae bacterium ADurb.BinA184]